jgi:ABC-2 type transport system ATP-binding protein
VNALQIRGLSKSYPSGHLLRSRRTALRGLDLTVGAGEVFGYLGPNGSGKTTTLKLLVGLLRPDAGEVEVLGLPHSRREWRHRVGYLPEHPYFYDYLSVREYLDYAGRLFGLPRAARRARGADLLARLGLAPAADVPLRRVSKGMLQRAGLAQALINDPELVILDEPMSGLDPLGRRLVRDLIQDLKRAGRTVLFSTHILSDAESLCDRVALLAGGELRAQGRLDEILKLDVAHLEVYVTGVAAALVSGLPALRAASPVGERWRLEVAEGSLAPVVAEVERAGGRILSLQPIRQSLEDYFVAEVAGEQGGRAWAD